MLSALVMQVHSWRIVSGTGSNNNIIHVSFFVQCKRVLFLCVQFLKAFLLYKKSYAYLIVHRNAPVSTPQTGLSRFVQPTSWEVAMLNNLLKQFVTHLLCCIYDEIRPSIPGILLFLTQS